MRRLLPSIAALGALATGSSAAEPWQDAIATGLGKPGMAMPGGVYRVGLPRTDLRVTLDGVQLKPSLALGSSPAMSHLPPDLPLRDDLRALFLSQLSPHREGLPL
ncbi:DUF1259 domain-containing protein [Methylobacterium nigriterrae]|uniref:DUF1259 domain-containing protein n=1 Tax=Methylobacterium nigriterrae TaxID=3127512 RepID=UPI003D67A004